MKPAPFDYIKPESSEELCELLANYAGDAAILAGGQSLLPLMNLRQRRPRLLLDLAGCHELYALVESDREISIAANVTQRHLELTPALQRGVSLLRQALPFIGNPQVRNRGTFCGSLAHAQPSAELPLVLLTLDGTVELQSARGIRRIAAADFFRGAFSTACQPDELIRSASLPRDSADAAYAFDEVALRSSGQAIIACAAVATHRSLRLAIAGASPRPFVQNLPSLPSDELAMAVAEIVREIAPIDDALATAAYRRQLIVSVGTAVVQSAERSLAGEGNAAPQRPRVAP